MSDQQCKDKRKLCIKNVRDSEIDSVLNLCEAIARVLNHNVHHNRNVNKELCMLFPSFNTEREATKVKEALTAQGWSVGYANTKRTEPQSPQPETSNNIFANFDENNPNGICIRCGEKAYYNCARCDDFYCSADCQRIDWPTHKLNCFPMPELLPSRIHQNLINAKSPIKPPSEAAPAHSSNGRPVEAAAGTSMSNGTTKAHEINHEKIVSPRQRNHDDSNGDNGMATPKPSTTSASKSSSAGTNIPDVQRIPNESLVVITYVRSHQKVFIRSMATDEAYKILVSDVAEAALTAPNLPSFPEVKTLVLAEYEGIYYRGLVLNCNKVTRTVRIAFIDFGNIEDVPFDKLKVLPAELGKRPRLTLLANLNSVDGNLTRTEETIIEKYLEEISELGECRVLEVRGVGEYIEKNDTIELMDMTTQQLVSDKIKCLLE